MFIVSRLVQGVTLGQYVKQTFGRVGDRTARIVKCIYPVLDALDYIHSKGIIHLDIKPSNIMVENGSNVRVMDLGIAFTSAQGGTGSSGLLGTPAMPPPSSICNPDRLLSRLTPRPTSTSLQSPSTSSSAARSPLRTIPTNRHPCPACRKP